MVLPRRAPHALADAPARVPVEGPEFMQAQQNSCPLVNDEDLACCVICGHFECLLQTMHPLIDGLPEMMHVRASALPCGAPERSALPLLITE